MPDGPMNSRIVLVTGATRTRGRLVLVCSELHRYIAVAYDGRKEGYLTLRRSS